MELIHKFNNDQPIINIISNNISILISEIHNLLYDFLILGIKFANCNLN